MEGEQRRRYDTMEEECRRGVARFIRDGTIVRRQVQILVMLLRLRQLCCHSLLVPEHEQPLPTDDNEGEVATMADEISPEVSRWSVFKLLAVTLFSYVTDACHVVGCHDFWAVVV